MNRKQLEECAWTKTPKDERRAKRERYDWKSQKTVVERLTGNAREVRVFDPSGSTEGTMSPWVPLWSLYSDELEQRCKEEREPKLRAPYNRMRSDYTGDVESSPGTKATREGASRQHATIRGSGQESFASLHRKAVRENLRADLDRALAEIKAATHVADYHSRIHAYGTEDEMHTFARGLSGVKVRPITARERQELSLRKRQAFGNP